MTDNSRLDRDSEAISASSGPRTLEPIPAAAVSEYADLYNLNDIGLAMRLWQTTAN